MLYFGQNILPHVIVELTLWDAIFWAELYATYHLLINPLGCYILGRTFLPHVIVELTLLDAIF
jgi:hypothetical protein